MSSNYEKLSSYCIFSNKCLPHNLLVMFLLAPITTRIIPHNPTFLSLTKWGVTYKNHIDVYSLCSYEKILQSKYHERKFV